MLRKIMFIPDDKKYEKLFGKGSLDREWFVPEGDHIARDCCYSDDGSPILLNDAIMKVGKRKFAKLVFD